MVLLKSDDSRVFITCFISAAMDFVKCMLIIVLCSIGEENGSVDGAEESDSKIQGGVIADIRKFPFVGSLQIPVIPRPQKHTCTTALVDTMTAITAGHCVVMNKTRTPLELIPVKYFIPHIVMGVVNQVDVSNSNSQKRNVVRFHIHENAQYGLSLPIQSRYDLGAIKLEKPMTLSPTVQLAPLIPAELKPPTILDKMINTKADCEIAGWGALKVKWSNLSNSSPELPFSPVLQVAKFHLISKKDCCQNYFRPNLNACTQRLGEVSGYNCYIRKVPTTSASSGDSGAPVYCSYKGRQYVVGINVAGKQSRETSSTGTVEVYHPGFLIEESVMAAYIKKVIAIRGMTSGCQEDFGRTLIFIAGFLSQLQWLKMSR